MADIKTNEAEFEDILRRAFTEYSDRWIAKMIAEAEREPKPTFSKSFELRMRKLMRVARN